MMSVEIHYMTFTLKMCRGCGSMRWPAGCTPYARKHAVRVLDLPHAA